MSANLDLVRSICAPWWRGDFSSTAWAHPEIEYVIVGGPSPGSWTGVAGLEEGSRNFLSAWAVWHGKLADVRELDEERVLVLEIFEGVGKISGIDVGQMGAEGAHVFHIRDDKVIRLVTYWDRELALADLADLGLTPEAS